MSTRTDDLRVRTVRPLTTPALLMEEVPVSSRAAEMIASSRRDVASILSGDDGRLLVVVGPCSIHSPAGAIEYANRLVALREEVGDQLFIVMRTYFEKPRTTTGWKGLINDPRLDGSFDINRGLRVARQLLTEIAELGLPVGVEFLDPISPQYLCDLVSWGAIGARTTESQVHREMSSGLSMPIGFKNGTDGNVQIAVDAVSAARNPHRFLGVTKDGLAAIVETTGNRDCHVILRGARSGTNYDEAHVSAAAQLLEQSGLTQRVMVDLSHGNSRRRPEEQPRIARIIGEQLGLGHVSGVMIESFLEGGRQDLGSGRPIDDGVSVTDPCLGWSDTRSLLCELAGAVRSATRSAGAENDAPGDQSASAGEPMTVGRARLQCTMG